jgi:hypothetical protein
MTASGTATVTVTGLTTGTAVLVAQWFGNLGGTEVKVAYPPPTPTLTPTVTVPVTCSQCLYLPLILKTPASVSYLPPRGPAAGAGQVAAWTGSVPLGEAVALVKRPGQ